MHTGVNFRAMLRLKPQQRLIVQTQHTVRTFKPHLTHGAVWLAGHMVIQAITVKQTSSSTGKIKNNQACVFALDGQI